MSTPDVFTQLVADLGWEFTDFSGLGEGLRSPSPVEAAATAAALKVIEPAPQMGGLTPNWMQMRSERYHVVLSLLDKFEFEGKGLKELMSSVENEHLKNAIKQVLLSTSSSASVSRKSLYPMFLNQLRIAAATIESSSLDYRLVNELCLAHFSVDIEHSLVGKKYVNEVLGQYQPASLDQLSADEIDIAVSEVTSDKSLQIKCTDLKRRLAANNLIGYWDPSLYSVRSKLAEVQFGNQKTTFLRMACPVVGYNADPQIDPIFKSMLRALKDQGKKYLYINNQSLDAKYDKRAIQSTLESNRSQALHALSRDPEFSQMFHVISLAHDSAFYKKGDLSIEAIKTELCTHLMRGTQGYQLPYNFDAEGGKIVQKIINDVANKYFPNRKDLEAHERKQFLHIAYACLTRKVIEDLKVDVANITCKDGVDRAAGSAVNLFAISDQEIPFEDTLWTLVFPATLNHGRAPQHHRHSISIPTLQRIHKFN